MASARRIVSDLVTAVKQQQRKGLSSAAGISQWSRREMSSGRSNDPSTAVKQWPGIPDWSSNKCPSIDYNKNTEISINTHHEYFDVADLLSTPERDFLVRNHNGLKVPVSSLKGKLVGLYLCISRPYRPTMEAINKVYEEAKSRGLDFEIVYINRTERQLSHGISWLSLPSTDSSFTKIQRIFQCLVDREDGNWVRDSLVLVYPCHDDSSGFLFEFSGLKILQRWGVEGFPFTRPSLYKAEYELQKRVLTLQLLFPPGKHRLLCPRPGGDGYDFVDAFTQLSGKRVLVLFAKNSFARCGANFLSVLKREYEAQLEDNVAGGSKFEVVYISTESSRVSFSDVSAKDMPWLVQPFPSNIDEYHLRDLFKLGEPEGSAAVAFNEQGELIAKEDRLHENKEGRSLQFPFIDQDLEKCIRAEVEAMCNNV